MSYLKAFLSNTKYVVCFCAMVLFVALGLRGSLFDFFKIQTVKNQISEEIQSIEMSSKALRGKLEVVKDPKFIEKKIKEQFDYAKEGDLVFIFSSNK